LLNLVGMKSGCEEENNQLVSESLPPLDVDLYNRADAVFCTPLSFFFFFLSLENRLPRVGILRLGFAKSERRSIMLWGHGSQC